MTNQQWKNFYVAMIGFFAGAMAGAISAMLFAPKSGRETRKLIVKSGKQAYGAGKQKVASQAGKLKGSVKSLGSKIKKASA